MGCWKNSADIPRMLFHVMEKMSRTKRQNGKVTDARGLPRPPGVLLLYYTVIRFMAKEACALD